jgi:hypothetical protein
VVYAAARTAVARARAGQGPDPDRDQSLSLSRSLTRRSRRLPEKGRARRMDGAGPDRVPARLPASSAMLRAHVTTVISAFSGKCLAISIVVDPESRRIVSPGRIVAPATRPIRRFASAWLSRVEVEGSIRPRLGLRYRHRSAGSALAPRARRRCHWSQSGTDATRSGYTVGYFESFGVGSLLAVADAAEATRSPVILGFSGVSLPHPARQVRDRLYAVEARLTRNFAIPAARLAEIETAGSGPDSGVGSGLRRANSTAASTRAWATCS